MKLFFLCLALLCFFPALVYGEGGSGEGLKIGQAALRVETPRQVIERPAQALIERLKTDKELIAKNAEHAKSLVKEILFPVVARKAFAKKVLGNHWKKMTPEQRQEFVRGLSKLMVKSYAGAFSEVGGQALEFSKPRYNKKADRAVVSATVKNLGEKPLKVQFRLYHFGKDRDKKWLVTDAVIEGVSLAKTYRGQFYSLARKEGIEAVIALLNAETGKVVN